VTLRGNGGVSQMEEEKHSALLSRREAIARSQPFETGSTERVRRLNGLLLSRRRPGICLHRARSYTKVFAQTEGEPTVYRFARAFARTLEEMPPVIAEGEFLVGSPTCKIRHASFLPEIASGWLRNEIDILANRPWDPFDVTPEQVAEIKEMLPFWQGKTLLDHWLKAVPPDLANRVSGKGWADCWAMLLMQGYHFTPPFEDILRHGFSGYEVRIKEALTRVDPNDTARMGGRHFYEALLILIDAIRGFAAKYSRKALQLAHQEPDPKRKEELVAIAEMTSRVPYYGARSFHEAVQAVCFVMALMHVEGTGPVYTVGRIDQYLYPFYQTDREKQIVTREQAQELIELLFIKLTGTVMFWSSSGARCSPGYKPTQTICIGGVNTEGRDATNELSYIILDAAESVRTIQPDIVLLTHPRETPYALKRRGAELTALGLGIPKFENTETIKAQLMDIGYTLEEAKIGWVQGCSEPEGPGAKQYGHTDSFMLNLPMALECLLFRGRKRMPDQPGSGEMLGLDLGDPTRFETFDNFMEGVKKELAQQILDGHTATSWAEWVSARHFPLLLQSILTDACIERGLPTNAGGAKIAVGPGVVVAGGLATLADSLAAIKKLVYDEKRLPLAELLRAVDANFIGHETLRDTLCHRVPKYGNDDDSVDQIAKDIYNFISAEAKSHVSALGNRNFATTTWPMSNMFEGAKTWATPNGRKAGEPFSNHLGPTDGMDVNGAVCNINSVTKLDHDRQFGIVHNLYFVNIENDAKIHEMLNLTDYFFTRGGHHVQINCQDKEVFMEAKKHPERYRGLMVRVAGYVAYFVELSEELQDQIIGRTSHYA
ncbi:MAG: pyruvate formate lyase family protein, partial [Pseudomonadota bacterium]